MAPSITALSHSRFIFLKPSVHAHPFFAATESHPKLYKSVTWGPFPDLKTYEYVLEKYLHKEAGSVLFAIFDKDPATRWQRREW
jgi:hypothetical protein